MGGAIRPRPCCLLGERLRDLFIEGVKAKIGHREVLGVSGGQGEAVVVKMQLPWILRKTLLTTKTFSGIIVNVLGKSPN